MLTLKELPRIEVLLPKFIKLDDFIPRWNIEYSFEPKFDGIRTIVKWTKTEGPAIQTRYGTPLKGIPKDFLKILHDALRKTRINNMILDSELIAIDKDHLAGNIDILQSHQWNDCVLQLRIFDILFANDIDLRQQKYKVRRAILEKYLNLKGLHLKISPVRKSLDEATKIFPNQEGVVTKNISSPYFGGRQSFWLKLRPIKTTDFIVIGVVPGIGSDIHTFAALILGRKVTGDYNELKIESIGSVGTGFTQEQRINIENWILKYCQDGWKAFIVECTYQRWNTNGQVVHPKVVKLKFIGE